MKTKPILLTLLTVVVCLGLTALIWPFAFTVVPIAEVEQVKESEAFDPVAYVDGIWSTQILPTIQDNAVDLATILNAMQPNANGKAAKEDLIKVAEQYGLITDGEAHVYMVKGRGQVVDIDTESSTGMITVLLDGYNGPIKVKLFIGPRIPSDETSVRDGVGFITFGDFKEQTEYGKVASELNKRVNAEVLAPLDKESLQGKTISFTGVFTNRTFNLIDIDLSEIRIVPTSITVE